MEEQKYATENKKTEIMGWVSFGLGIATWILVFISILLSPAAIVLGIISLVKEGKNWMAIVGLILGAVSVLFMIFGMIILLAIGPALLL